MEFPRQEYWSELPFPSPGDLSDPETEPESPALADRFFTAEPPGKPLPLWCQLTNQIAKFSGALWANCEMWLAWNPPHHKGNIYTMEINCKSGVSAYLFEVSLSVYTIKKHQSSHSWLFLHCQEIEWLWTSHTTSLTFSLFIYKRWSRSSWPSSLLTPLKFCYIVSPSSVIPTYNTTKQHISVNSCDFRQSFYAPQDGVGPCPPLRSHCSPRFPLCFEKQACRNSLDPQTLLVSCPPKPSDILFPICVPLSYDLSLWLTPTDSTGALLEEIATPRKPSLIFFIQPRYLCRAVSGTLSFPHHHPCQFFKIVIVHFIVWHPHPNLRARRAENVRLFLFMVSAWIHQYNSWYTKEASQSLLTE